MPMDFVAVLVVSRQAREDLDPTLLHATHRHDSVADRLQSIRAALHDDDLQAEVVGEVHVHRRTNPLTELVLQVGELLAQIADVVVVDQGQRGHRVNAARYLRPADLGSSEIAKKLRARAATGRDEGVQLA